MKTLKALLLSFGVVAAAACNTISGAGEDISAGGEAISDTAEATKKEIAQ